MYTSPYDHSKHAKQPHPPGDGVPQALNGLLGEGIAGAWRDAVRAPVSDRLITHTSVGRAGGREG